MLSEAADCANSPPPLTRQPMEAVPMAETNLHPDFHESKCCKRCGQHKLVPDFISNQSRPDRLAPYCRDCRKLHCREWYQRNLDSERERARNRMRVYGPKERERNKKWALANPEQARHHSRKKLLRKKYDMTIEQHDALFASQGFACGACGSPEPNSKKGWSTDHCHESGVVRGIVCHHCNIGLGHAKDSIATLHKWVAYLERAPGAT